MRVVLDTNVLMSGIFFGGIPGRILSAWASAHLELVLSPEILEEYRRVGALLGARYPDRSAALEPVLALLAMNAVLVTASRLPNPVSADPEDDKDRDLLDAPGWQGIAVLTPRQFASRHLAGS